MRLPSAERFLAVASARSLTGCRAVAPDAVPLRPAGSITTGALDFSFADLRTAVARWVEARQDAGQPVPVSDVGASFLEAVTDVLTARRSRPVGSTVSQTCSSAAARRPAQGLRGSISRGTGVELQALTSPRSGNCCLVPDQVQVAGVIADRAAGQPCGWLGSGSMAAAVAGMLRGGPGGHSPGPGDDDSPYTGRYQIPSLTSVITLVLRLVTRYLPAPESQAGWTRFAQRGRRSAPRSWAHRAASSASPLAPAGYPTLRRFAGYSRSEAWQSPGRSVPQPARAGCA